MTTRGKHFFICTVSHKKWRFKIKVLSCWLSWNIKANSVIWCHLVTITQKHTCSFMIYLAHPLPNCFGVDSGHLAANQLLWLVVIGGPLKHEFTLHSEGTNQQKLTISPIVFVFCLLIHEASTDWFVVTWLNELLSVFGVWVSDCLSESADEVAHRFTGVWPLSSCQGRLDAACLTEVVEAGSAHTLQDYRQR